MNIGNFIFLVVIFLFYAIAFVSVYQLFRRKKTKPAIFLLIYSLTAFVITIIYFFTRGPKLETELELLINGLSSGQVIAYLVLLLNLILIGLAGYSYLAVRKLIRKK